MKGEKCLNLAVIFHAQGLVPFHCETNTLLVRPIVLILNVPEFVCGYHIVMNNFIDLVRDMDYSIVRAQ